MRLLCDFNMMIYVQCEQIDPQKLSGNVHGYNYEGKNPYLQIIACLPVYAPKHPDALTINLNGHEASVLYPYNELRIV